MNTLITLVILTVLLFVFVLIYLRKEKKRVTLLLHRQAAKNNGAVEEKPGSFYPIMFFLYRGKKVVVETAPRWSHNAPAVRVTIEVLTYRDCRIEMVRNGFFSATSFLHLDRVRLGHPNFDAKIIIRSDDDYYLKQLFVPAIHRDFLEFKQYPLFLKFSKNNFQVSTRKIPKEEAQYGELIDLVILLYNRILETSN